MRDPQMEYHDAIGAGQPIRETMAQRQRPVDVGRPRGAAARAAGHGPDAATRQMRADWRGELAAMKARLADLERAR